MRDDQNFDEYNFSQYTGGTMNRGNSIPNNINIDDCINPEVYIREKLRQDKLKQDNFIQT
jgi:hypothetical protein